MATVDQIKNSAVVTRTRLEIGSFFKTSGTNSNFMFDVGTTINNVQLIEIRGINFVNVVNNVDINNNGFNWIDSLGVTHFNQIPIGNYDDTSLCDAITNVLNTNTTAIDFYTCEIDRVNTTFVIINGVAGTTFDLLFGVSADESIGKDIGFGVSNYRGITSQRGPQLLNLTATKGLYIGSTTISEGSSDVFQVSNGASNIISRYNLAGFFGDTIRDLSIISIKEDDISIKEIDFRLLDDSGTEIIMPSDPTHDYFSITLDIYSGIFDLTYYD